MNDPKAWVRQWTAIVFAIFLIIGMGVEIATELQVPNWYIGISSTVILWFFGSREFEKWKNRRA